MDFGRAQTRHLPNQRNRHPETSCHPSPSKRPRRNLRGPRSRARVRPRRAAPLRRARAPLRCRPHQHPRSARPLRPARSSATSRPPPETGTKSDTPIVQVPQTINVVTADQIRDQGAQSVSQALGYTPGVSVEQFRRAVADRCLHAHPRIPRRPISRRHPIFRSAATAPQATRSSRMGWSASRSCRARRRGFTDRAAPVASSTW